MGTAAGLVLVAALVAATAFFVAVEFAFVAARRSRLEQLALDGARGAAAALAVKRQLQFVLSAAQLGITVVSLVLGFVAEGTLGNLLRPVAEAAGLSPRTAAWVAVTAGFLLATGAQMVLGELVPKNLAIARPEGTARALGYLALGYTRASAPVTRVFDRAAAWIVRRAGVDPDGDGHHVVSVEELDRIVAESAQKGELTEGQAELLSRGLDFEELRASQVMVPWNRTVRIWGRQSCEGLRTVMSSGHTRFPVVGAGGTVVGVVHAKDLLRFGDEEWARHQVVEVARDALVVPETCRVRTVLTAMREASTELAVVADEFGAPAGIVTLEDLLEELVGEIDDEFDDTPAQGCEALEDGSVLVPGRWRIDEVARSCGVQLPAGDGYATVAGLVLHRAQRLVAVGDHVDVDGTTVEVTAVDGWAVTQVRIHTSGGDRDGPDSSGDTSSGEAAP